MKKRLRVCATIVVALVFIYCVWRSVSRVRMIQAIRNDLRIPITASCELIEHDYASAKGGGGLEVAWVLEKEPTRWVLHTVTRSWTRWDPAGKWGVPAVQLHPPRGGWPNGHPFSGSYAKRPDEKEIRRKIGQASGILR